MMNINYTHDSCSGLQRRKYANAKAVRLPDDVKLTMPTSGTSESDVKPGWKVWDDSERRYVDVAKYAITLNYYGLDSPQRPKSNHDCTVGNDDKLIALHRFTQSDRANYWLENLEPRTITDSVGNHCA